MRTFVQKAVNDGKQIREKLVKNHPNFFLAFSGHMLHEGYGRLVNEGTHGNDVYKCLANYPRGVKGCGNDCNGYLRIVDINLKDPIHHLSGKNVLSLAW